MLIRLLLLVIPSPPHTHISLEYSILVGSPVGSHYGNPTTVAA